MKTKILLLLFTIGAISVQTEAQNLLQNIADAIQEGKENKKVSNTNKKESTQKFSSQTSSAQKTSTDEVTLVVSADGMTKDEATKAALRSAIEQAYGTFVSANTTLLNDELVKDEIVTVSSGNIKKYNELSSSVMPDGRVFVTLQATLSISKLTNYAQNKGAEVEFAGATFAMQKKLERMYKNNEIKAINNMYEQLRLIPNLFDYELEMGEPQEPKYEPIGGKSEEKYYSVDCIVYLLYNNNTQLYNDIVYNTLKSLSVPKEARTQKETIIHLPLPEKASYISDSYKKKVSPVIFYLRSDAFSIEMVQSIIKNTASQFMISDNISSPTKLESIIYKPFTYECENFKRRDKGFSRDYTADPFCYYSLSETKDKIIFTTTENTVQSCGKIGDRVGMHKFRMIIPEKDIEKYTNFRIERKN